jgi:hypothetical protein
MATRDLSRTIIEGGRHYDSSFDRKIRNRRRRRVRFDEYGDPIGRPPDPGTSCLYHHDRLAPLRRWLRSHVGRPWSKVFQESCERFDVRTMKGWHLRGHLRSYVETEKLENWTRFYVDAKGFLREHRRPRWPRGEWWTRPATYLDWADGRRVIVQGDALYWTAGRRDPDSRKPFVSRQGARLTDDEVEHWNGLREVERRALRYWTAVELRRALAEQGRARR